jgi:GNAT superfamily N-acetyltransferase
MITLYPMTGDDVPLGMRLKTLAGWNQTQADWLMLLEAGFGLVAVVDGIGVGTATVVPYDGVFAWIGMVLVDPHYRRRGIGTTLLEAAIAAASEHGTPCLDATPQGRPLYARLGFHASYDLVRMQRSAATTSPGPYDGDTGIRCEVTKYADLPDLIRYDAAFFGAERAKILQALWTNRPDCAALAHRDGALVGYCLGRSGSAAEQIGPVIAEDLETARSLLGAALQHCDGHDVIVDVAVQHADWLGYLADLGFTRLRSFTRMYLGDAPPLGLPRHQFAIAGPEIG